MSIQERFIAESRFNKKLEEERERISRDQIELQITKEKLQNQKIDELIKIAEERQEKMSRLDEFKEHKFINNLLKKFNLS